MTRTTTRVHELSRADARRIAVRAQLLTKERPTDLIETVRQLSLVQLEPTSAIAPSAELVLWSRLGSAFSAAGAVGRRRRAAADRAAPDAAGRPRTWRSSAPRWPCGPAPAKLREWQEDVRDWVTANNDCRRDILERLRADGPLPAQRAARHLRRAVALQRLEQQPQRPDDARHAGPARRGRRRGRRPAASGCGTSPPGSTPTTRCPRSDEARRLRRRAPPQRARHRPRQEHQAARRAGRRRRGRRAGRGRGRARRSGGSTRPSSASRSPAAPRCCRRSTGCSPTASGWTRSSSSTTSSRCTSPPPPACGATTRCRSCTATGWSGSSTPKADRKDGVLRVAAIHQDVPFSKAMTAAVDREINDLARWLDLELELPE